MGENGPLDKIFSGFRTSRVLFESQSATRFRSRRLKSHEAAANQTAPASRVRIASSAMVDDGAFFPEIDV